MKKTRKLFFIIIVVLSVLSVFSVSASALNWNGTAVTGVGASNAQGKKGYKFPTSEKELADFYDRLRDNVIPQLKRCRILNNVLQEKSIGKYGVLKHEEYRIVSSVPRNSDIFFSNALWMS